MVFNIYIKKKKGKLGFSRFFAVDRSVPAVVGIFPLVFGCFLVLLVFFFIEELKLYNFFF